MAALGIPSGVTALLFDLDGVLTQTAKVHAAAWKQMFDAYLEGRAAKTGSEFVPFDEHDYSEYVDGKLARYEGHIDPAAIEEATARSLPGGG